MSRSLLSKFLLLTIALLFSVKPIVGFHLYAKTEPISSNELITIIKAFSKRKQEYLDDLLCEVELSQQVRSATLQPLARLIVQFIRLSVDKLHNCQNQLQHCAINRFWPFKQYLIFEQLAL